MTNELKNCPEPNVLLSFLQGTLFSPQLDQCESHVKDCELCHETLAGLVGNDTLSERISEALEPDAASSSETDLPENKTDSIEINNLLSRLNSDDFKRDAMQFHPNKAIYGSSVESEVIADRAAEVLRCITPATDTLGVLGEYSLVRLIGAGSTGVVFQAIDQTLERTVALKVLRPSLGEIARNRFLIEAKLAASIEHENVVTIFQVGQVDRLAFMAMPWLPGQTLESLLASGEDLNEEQIIEIIRQVAAGLDAAHQQQLVHRDIKPANLWICEDDSRLKILDFGLARISDDNPNLTATGMLAGTPNFMSPEQTRGLELDGRSDLFSLGCVLYRLLAGRLPFGSPTVLATLSSIQTHNPVPPAELQKNVNRDLSDLTMCLLEKQPINRPQSATQTIELLTTPRDQWPLAVQTYAATPASNTEAHNRPPIAPNAAGSGRRWSSWIPAVIALAMLGTFGWMFAPQIIRVATDKGEVVIETTDDNVEVQVLQDGKVVRVIDTQTQQSFSLKSGQYSFNAKPSDDEAENSFAISPQTLTMRRGEKAIVSVTSVPKTNAESWTDPSIDPKQMGAANRPIYRGKTFEQWMKIAKFERDYSTQLTAFKASEKTVETKKERAVLLELTSKLARIYGTSNPRHDKGHHATFMKVLNACETNTIVDFIKNEISEGTLKSRQFCTLWLLQQYPRNQRGLIDSEVREKAGQVKKRIFELEDVILENFDKAGVVDLLESLLWNDKSTEPQLARLRKSKVGTKIRTSVLSGTVEDRMRLLSISLGMFADDSKVIEAYLNDLLNPTVEWPSSRNVLFNTMMEFILPSDPKNKESIVDSAKFSEQLEIAVGILAKVTTGILSKGDKRLKFRLTDGGYGVVMGAGGIENNYATTADAAQMLLQHFYNVGLRTEEERIRQPLLEKLKAIKGALYKELDASNWVNQTTLDDLDYLIAYFDGNPPSLLPANSSLWGGPPRAEQVNKAKPERSKKKTFKTTTSPKKPIYKGKTFDQWIETAKIDRDTTTKTQALIACAATVETPQEETQLLELTRLLARKHGAGYVGNNDDTDMFHHAFMTILNSCDDDEVIDFIDSEIANGTVKSRQFCYSWIHVITNQSFTTVAQQKRRNRIRMRVAEFGKTIAANLNKPYVNELSHALLPETVDAEEALNVLRNSNLATEVKNFVQTASLQKRYEISKFALRLLPDDQEILSTYRKDLSDPNLDNATIEKPETMYSEITNWAGGTSQPWPVAKANLLSTMLYNLAPTADWKGERPLIAPEVETRRFTLATNLLAEVVEGLDPNGKKKLLFQHNPQGVFGMTPPPRETMPPRRLGRTILQAFHNIGQRTKDEKLKQSLIGTLERFTSLLGPEANVPEGSPFGQQAPLTDQIAYVMANLKGNPKKELPVNSWLRNDRGLALPANDSAMQYAPQQTEAANEVDQANHADQKNVVVTKPFSSASNTTNTNKPFYQGKTFDHWMRTAQFDRDPATQLTAIEACMTLAESDQEIKQLLQLAGSLARSVGSIIDRGKKDTRSSYSYALVKVLDLCDVDQIIDFIKLEIAEGTIESRNFCVAWMAQLFRRPLLADSNGGILENKKVTEIKKRITQLLPTIEEHFENEGVPHVLGALLPRGEDVEPQLESIRNSPVGAKIKAHVFSDKLQTRIVVANLAISLFVDDEKVLEVYKKDLLDPRLKDSVKSFRGFEMTWAAARNQLFYLVMGGLLPPTQSIAETEANDPKVIRRTAAAADILAKITDGILADGEDRLTFSQRFGNSGRGGGGIARNLDDGAEATLKVTGVLSQNFYDIAMLTEDDTIKHLLLQKLEAIKNSVDKELTATERSNNGQTLKDLDYLIAYFKGSPPAKLPVNSRLWDGSPRESGLGGGMF